MKNLKHYGIIFVVALVAIIFTFRVSKVRQTLIGQ